MLLKDFYTILEIHYSDKQTLISSIEIQKHHPLFAGHFPNHPVTPGVAMLQIIKELAQKHCPEINFLEAASQVKFLNLVDPNVDAILIFNLHFHEDDNYLKVKNITSFKDKTTVLKCNVTFVKR